MIKKILKILLAIIIWVAIAAALIVGCAFLELPLEWGAGLAALLFLLWYGIKLIRFLWARWRAKQRVRHLVNIDTSEQPEPQEKTLGLFKKPSELEHNFKQISALLHESELHHHGDPLYVLPWFLLIGESDDKFQKLLSGARLPEPTLSADHLNQAELKVAWQLYNQGVIVRSDGKFMAGSAQSSDPDWLDMLETLVKYRPLEPVNGLIITVSIEKLLDGDVQGLMDYAQKVRRLIEDSVQVLGVQVPVYVVITGLEKLEGIDYWVEHLSKEQLQQAVGRINSHSSDAGEFVADVLDDLGRRLRSTNLKAVKARDIPPNLMRLPARIEMLKRPLSLFSETLFQTNPYQKTPQYRGLFFAANVQSGNDTYLSAFVADLFTKVIPQDRCLIEMDQERRFEELSRHRKSTIAWAAITGVALVAIWSLYWHDQSQLQDLYKSYTQQTAEYLTADGKQLDGPILELNASVELVEELASKRWAPWYNPVETPAFVEQMKARIADSVHEELIQPIDTEFGIALESQFFNTVPGSEREILQSVSTYTGIIVRRINILNAYLNGSSQQELLQMPMPYQSRDVAGVSDGVMESINELYVQSLFWREPDGVKGAGDTDVVVAQRNMLQADLDRILKHNGGSLRWVINWVNADPAITSYRLGDLWQGGTGRIEMDIEIPGAYTLAGKESIDTFIEQLIKASPDSDAIEQMLPDFKEYYRENYVKAWRELAENFNRGLATLKRRSEFLAQINNLSTGQNLYFKTLDLVSDQMSPFTNETIPDWLYMVNYYQDMAALKPDESVDTSGRDKVLTKLALKTVGSLGPIGKALSKKAKGGLKTKKKLDKASGGPSLSEREIRLQKAAELLDEYRNALKEVVYNAQIQSVSYDMAKELFKKPDDPAAGTGPYALAFAAVQKLQALVGKPDDDNMAFWQLYMGPLKLVEEFAVEEASCGFEELYNEKYLAEIDGVPSYKKEEFAYGESGILWTFISEQAGPFLKERAGKGFVPVKARNKKLHFNQDFITYLSKAKDHLKAADNYKVTLNTRPTNTNIDSLYHVSETTLSLACAAGPLKLVNRNFPDSQTFIWDESCGDTRLQIKIGRLELEIEYPGTKGFLDFIHDFRRGYHRYKPQDFPDYTKQLREYGVSFIELQYDMRGHLEILKMLDTKPMDAPKSAASCWQP